MVLAYNAGTIPQPNIICYQIKSPVPGMGYILLSCQPMGHREPPPQHYRLFPRILVTIHS